MARRTISQPTLDDERDLLAIMDDESSFVTVRGKRMQIGMLTGHAQHKITRILLGKGNETTITHKCLAAARLNGYFGIKLLWPILWRWYYYIRQYREDELSEAISLIKKKVPLAEYLANTTLLIGMRETMMQMNREEVFRILQEQSGGNAGNSARNANGSPVR